MARVVHPSQTRDTKIEDRTYFKKKHQNEMFLEVNSVWFSRRCGGHVSAVYKLSQTGKDQHRVPAHLTRWLDDKDHDFIDRELKDWQRRINTEFDVTSVSIEPEFYARHKGRFIGELKTQGLNPKSIEGYLRELRRYVFPYFIGRMAEHNVKQWRHSYISWYQWIETRKKTASSRKKPIVALRRYLRFYGKVMKQADIVLPEAPTYRDAKNQFLPGGEIPDDTELAAWINTLPNDQNKWVIAIMAAFGVRISEALAIDPYSLVGKGSIDKYLKNDRLVDSVRNKHNPKLFCFVDHAVKRAVTDADVRRRFGSDPDDDPKSGSYTAGCFSRELAQQLVDMVDAKIYSKGDEATADSVYRTMKQTSHPLFSQYSPHDLRRLSITCKALDTHDFFAVSKLHGHSTESTTRRYYKIAVRLEREQRSNVDFSLELL